jgi:hypothetical protein
MPETPLAKIADGPQFRDVMATLPGGHCSDGVFELCLGPIVYSRHHWLKYKGEYRVRADLRGVLEDLRSRDPRGWDDVESDFMLALYALGVSNVGLDELKDRVDGEAVREVLLARYRAYAPVAEPGAVEPAELSALAERVSALRTVVERTHLLYSVIDGKAWFRDEGLMARGAVADDVLTPTVEAVVSAGFSVAPGGSAEERLREATRACLDLHGDSAPLVRAIMDATLLDPVLRADHVTLTCPMGDLLETPDRMTTSEAFFTETQLREGLALDEDAERLGHESSEQLQRTIKARMLKLKRGAIRGLYGPGCLQGRFVEKHGGHMIFRNEDAHYRGHQSIGCSSGGRASFALRYRVAGRDDELTAMVGDYRVVRMSHDERDTFSGEELVDVIRYATWIRVVVEETYRHGAVVRKDETPRTQAPASLSA